MYLCVDVTKCPFRIGFAERLLFLVFVSMIYNSPNVNYEVKLVTSCHVQI